MLSFPKSKALNGFIVSVGRVQTFCLNAQNSLGLHSILPLSTTFSREAKLPITQGPSSVILFEYLEYSVMPACPYRPLWLTDFFSAYTVYLSPDNHYNNDLQTLSHKSSLK